jgi:probable lipoprotein NlpC
MESTGVRIIFCLTLSPSADMNRDRFHIIASTGPQRKRQTRREAGTESHGSGKPDSRVAATEQGGAIRFSFSPAIFDSNAKRDMKSRHFRRHAIPGFCSLLLLFVLTACSGFGPASGPTPVDSGMAVLSTSPRPVARAVDGPRPVRRAETAESRTLSARVSKALSEYLPEGPPEAPADEVDPDDAEAASGLTDMDMEMLAEISERLDLDVDGSENPELLFAIESWMGTPYRYGGCSRFGVDCSCLVKAIYDEVFGVELTRTSRSMYDTLPPVDPEDMREGDILCFRGRRGRNIGHVGLYLKDGKFVHASRSNGVIISDIQENYYRKRFAGARRVIPSKAMELLRLLTRNDP